MSGSATTQEAPADRGLGWLAGGGPMGVLFRSYDWARTPFGPAADWPPALRTAVGILLGSAIPAYLVWGPDLALLYNHAYRPLLGNAPHPEALGRTARECFADSWAGLGPAFERVMATGETVTRADEPVRLVRGLLPEECYFTFGYGPIRDETGAVAGVFVTATETTERLIGEQRFRQLADHLPSGFIYQVVQSPDGPAGFLYASAGVEPLLGIKPEELATDPIALYRQIVEEDFPRMRAQEEECLRDRKPFDCQFRTRRPDGEVRWLHCRSAPRPLPGGGTVWDGIALDITDRKRAEEERERLLGEVLRAGRELQEHDRRKDEFLAMLGHELRNPLAPIRNAVQVIRLVGVADPMVTWARDLIDRQVQQLTRLVDDLLDVSRIAGGRIQLRAEQVGLADVIGRAVETVRSAIDDRRHELVVSLPTEPVYLTADLVRLTQVVGNLLANAAKYTEPGGRITLAAGLEGAEAVIRVRDTGIGIPPDMLQKVFDLFTQVESTVTRSEAGLGLGLTVVRRLVELHGGTVEAHSDGVGKGCEFAVRLPAEPAAAHPTYTPPTAPGN